MTNKNNNDDQQEQQQQQSSIIGEEFKNFEHFQSTHNQFSEIRQHDAYMLYLDLKFAKQQPLQEYHQLAIKPYPNLERYCIHAILKLPIGKEESELAEEDESSSSSSSAHLIDDNPLSQVNWKLVKSIFVPISTHEDMSFDFCWKICEGLGLKQNLQTNRYIHNNNNSNNTTTTTAITGEANDDEEEETIVVSFAFVDSDSSITYYQIAQNIMNP